MALSRLWNPLFLTTLPRAVCSGRALRVSATRGEIFDVKGKKDFDERVIKADKPVVVDFHAEWCGPCKQLGPLIVKIVESRKDAVDLAKVDIDELQELAIEYGVNAVPTVALVSQGNLVKKFVGVQTEQYLEDFVPK